MTSLSKPQNLYENPVFLSPFNIEMTRENAIKQSRSLVFSAQCVCLKGHKKLFTVTKKRESKNISHKLIICLHIIVSFLAFINKSSMET